MATSTANTPDATGSASSALSRKPKWQRARIVHVPRGYESRLGYELWVKAGPPVVVRRTNEKGRYETAPAYDTNILAPREGFQNPLVAVGVEDVELIARSAEDFADDVPLISFEDWLKEQQ